MKAAKGTAGEPSLTLVVIAGLILRLALFHLPGLEILSKVLERRPELSTPISSFMSVKEGIHLRSLHRSSPATIPKPYQGGSLHLSPVLLAFLGPALSNRTAWELHFISSLLWTLFDVLAGLFIADLFHRKRRYMRKTGGNANSSGNSKTEIDLNMGHLLGSQGGIAALYLFNPYTIATCLARSTVSISNVAVLAAIDSAMIASPILLAFTLSTATFISLYPALLSPSLILLSAKVALPTSRKKRGHEKSFSTQNVILSLFAVACGLALGTYLSFEAADRDWSFASRAYGTILLLPDLSPNIGLWWYFFIEIFDHFRDFFLLVFNAHVASYSIPLTIKYRQDPLFAVTVLSGLIATLKSYPTMNDTALFLSLLSLHPEIFPYLRYPLVTSLLFLYASILMPALHYLWLSAGSGNANFFYATTLVWAFAGGSAVLDCMWAWGRWRWELERPSVMTLTSEMKSRKVVQM